MHSFNVEKGSDPNNYVIRCVCGWAYSSTFLECDKHANHHLHDSKGEERRWDDPLRQYDSRYHVHDRRRRKA